MPIQLVDLRKEYDGTVAVRRPLYDARGSVAHGSHRAFRLRKNDNDEDDK